MSQYEQESFSFGTAELKNERHRSLCPPVLHHTLGQTASVGTAAYDHHSEEQRAPETAAPTAATWNSVPAKSVLQRFVSFPATLLFLVESLMLLSAA